MINKQDLVLFLENYPYRFAKSMPKIPHWYTLRKNWDDEKFVNVVNAIRHFGYDVKWGRSTYRYFDANGYHYWTMGDLISDTILINRAKIKYPTIYDDIATKYDSWYQTQECYDENLLVIKSLNLNSNSSVLDIGCGTGLLLDYVALMPLEAKQNFKYIGIDPSQEMLGVLTEKHPQYYENVYQSKFEDFYTNKDTTHVVSLFGSPSYINRNSINKLHSMCLNKKCFLMFYKDGYIPKYEQDADIEVMGSDDIFDLASALKAETFNYKQFTIIET